MPGISVSRRNVPIGGVDNALQTAPRREVEFVSAWPEASVSAKRDAEQYWHQYRLVSPADIEKRVSELAGLAYSGNELVAVSTVEQSEWMHLRLLHYRCSVAPSYRRREITWRLTGFTFRLLEEWGQTNPDGRAAGLLVTFEAPEFIGHLGQPIITKHGMDLVFVGWNAAGHQRRVIWFKQANLELSSLRSPA